VKPDTGIWDRLSKAVFLMLLVALVFLLAQFYVPLFKQNQRLRERNIRLEAAIQKGEAAGRRMEHEIESLQKDPDAIERLGREQLGYGKEGETIYRFESPDTNAPVR
jgi:cell division protein FtsB